jgi:4-amino-4-deoxy-L-arabinose transferase-like glycosyltransferase
MNIKDGVDKAKFVCRFCHPILHSHTMKTKLIQTLPFVFGLAFLCQGYFGNWAKSLTWDEPVFIASGFSYLSRNDFRMNPEAPPLMQQLQALPLLTLKLNQIDTHHPVWENAEHIVNARLFIEKNATHLNTISQRARLPGLLIGACLVLGIFFWAKALYGTWPALLASALAACSPNLLAHAKLATSDLGCAAFMFFSVWCFWRAVHASHWQTWLLCGVITGLALLTKYTALLLGPTFVLLGLFCVWQKILPFQTLVKGGLLVIFVGVLTIGAGYNFTFNPILYFHGLQKIYANANVGYQFYLLGEVSEQPFWYYYGVAFLIKTPVATLLLIGVGAAVFVRCSKDRNRAVFLLTPIVLIFVVSCFDRSNLGYRRILPALPFLFLFCAHTLSHVPSHFRKGFVVGLFCIALLESVHIYPHHLSFFNQAVGGPEQGPHFLDDSNIDWGQDLPGLAAWQNAHPTSTPLRQLYFGLLPPKLYGVTATQLPLNSGHIRQPQSGYYAISAHHLAWFRKIKKEHNLDIDWLTKYDPIARIGYSIFIYQFPRSDQK